MFSSAIQWALLTSTLVVAAAACSPEESAPAGEPEPDLRASVDRRADAPPIFSNDLESLPPQMQVQAQQRLDEIGGQRVGRMASFPVRTRPPRGSNNLQWLFTAPDALAPEWQRKAWNERMAPLLYPPGHPRAGEYRDEVLPEDVLVATLPVAEESFLKESLDQPMLHAGQKRLPLKEVAAAAERLWPGRDPGSSRAFYEWLVSQPDDPDQLPSDFWLPTRPDDPDATTHRAWLREEILRQAEEQLEAQRARRQPRPELPGGGA
jgi:hypothetical protein